MLHHMLTAVRAEWPKHLIILDVDPDAKSIEFDRATKFSILRIAHESIRNAARHSGVDQILVSIDRNEPRGDWQMEVVDQGKGFDVESLPEDHYGVLGCELRAKLLGAELSIHSTPGKGTQVRLSVLSQSKGNGSQRFTTLAGARREPSSRSTPPLQL